MVKATQGALWGMGITGLAGGLIGSFMGRPVYIVGMAGVGALLGFVIGIWGGHRFFMSVVIGAVIGGGLATYLAGASVSLLGAAAGGAMGGFLGVSLDLFLKK